MHTGRGFEAAESPGKHLDGRVLGRLLPDHTVVGMGRTAARIRTATTNGGASANPPAAATAVTLRRCPDVGLFVRGHGLWRPVVGRHCSY